MSYMTEILNSQSMKVSSGYDTMSLSTYWEEEEEEDAHPNELLTLPRRTLSEPRSQYSNTPYTARSIFTKMKAMVATTTTVTDSTMTMAL
ncbi:hypothetical protein EYF80_038426 [Liparis tanakae]|uniref:Uncharacterized protein n=1 Tax=Liparis tanakae TaxID=230148 RepID=A0A4Z2GDF5_9TELE|nr:hypothetical protein EYF80_038426 [Liparis tanakae]